MRPLIATLILSLGALAPAQTTGGAEIDDCGVLVQGNGCVLFEGAGGSWVLSDYGRFKIGDAVRVIGAADPDCTTFCPDADGCVRGAEIYSPAEFPCGTPIRSIEEDLLPSLCEAATGALTSATAAGFMLTRWRARVRRRRAA